MRRIKPEYRFDMWIPKLAPSEILLQAYVINKRINWKEFSLRYKKEILNKNQKMIKLLIHMSKYSDITLLCAEKSARYCHRGQILKECRKFMQENKG